MSYVEKSHSDYSINTWAVTSLPFSSFAAVHIFPMLRPLFCLLFCSWQITMTSQTDVRAPGRDATEIWCCTTNRLTQVQFSLSAVKPWQQNVPYPLALLIFWLFLTAHSIMTVDKSQSWRRCMSCRGREQAFSTLDRVTEQRETNQTGWKVTLLLFRPFFFFFF